MRIDQRQMGYGRGKLVTLYNSVGAAVPVVVTLESVSISVDDTFRVTLSRDEVDAICRVTYNIDWEPPQ